MFGAFKGNKQQQAQEPTVCDNALMFVDLEPTFDKSKIKCLNFEPNFPLESALFDKGQNLFLKSDADPQLVIQVGFNQQVRLHHLYLGCRNDESAPKILKLYANGVNMDFPQCENDTPSQEIELKEGDFNNDINLKYVKFQNINSITIFVEDNYGADETIINNLRFFGSTVKAANMANLKKVG